MKITILILFIILVLTLILPKKKDTPSRDVYTDEEFEDDLIMGIYDDEV